MNRPLYLDHAATTPVDARVVAAMVDCLGADGAFGNPASVTHGYGREAAERVEAARAEVAALIGCERREIVWTSGATEADNLALSGAARAAPRGKRHIVTLATEHKAVLDTCRQLARGGWEITCLAPAADGVLDLDQLAAALRDDTLLVSVMAVNNETGVTQDLEAIGRLTRSRGVLFHIDAAQAAGRIALDVARFEADLMSLSAHKAYGPKGVGALYVRRWPRARVEPLLHGGGQEHGLRAGTLATHQIVGMGEACRLAREALERDAAHLRALRERLWAGLRELGGVQLNGHATRAAGGILNVSVDGLGAESLLLALPGLALSAGSACTSVADEPSHVLRAMGLDAARLRSALRFSPGRHTTVEDIDRALEAVRRAVARLRALAGGRRPAPGAAPAAGAFGYGPVVLERFAAAARAGDFEPGTPGVARGQADDPAGTETLTVQLRVDARGMIAQARFRAHGSPALIAAGDFTAESVSGRTVEEARGLTHRHIAEALRLPPSRLPAAVLAGQALIAALDDAVARLLPRPVGAA
ncbi:cysteine desulfurase IscS [Plasticicumulans lactativorans]|uniref:cysteine desulfurase n=1 Tax=Plasticicumulans lactativorans TaxID=1133106 RepID=A0A4R2L8L2_9GAMM|nr:aminotransferase class V-fold PLP-dependent enzyme [Plasticicumulans lactativorans]TCO82402.1 cysteine desulfurase IscS [Plasticicumulans lactativorans]